MMIDKQEYNKRMRLINWAFIALVILFFAILVAFMVLLIQTHDLSQRAIVLSRNNTLLIHENEQRVRDDRNNKIVQCKHVYSGVKEVFEIFFPNHPTIVQKNTQNRFNRRIDKLQSNCEKQAGN